MKIKGKLRTLRDMGLRKLREPAFSTPLIVHWSIHKAMTGYYTQVMLELRKKTGLAFSAHYADSKNLPKVLIRSKKLPSNVVLLSDLLHYKIQPPLLYRGTLTLRDPRDLAISGYYYHLRTNENWVNDTNFNWSRILNDKIGAKFFGDRENSWNGKSYSTVLKSLKKADGLMLEIIRIAPLIRSIGQFDYNNPNILIVKFEDIIGREIEAFEEIFDHYGLHSRYKSHAMYAVDKLSASKNRGKSTHIRSTTTGEWRSEFEEQHHTAFKQNFGLQLKLAGYSPH